MKNYETEAAWRYHNGTKHPNGPLLDILHRYHPASRPYPYKTYQDCPVLALSPDKSPGKVSALDAISCTSCEPSCAAPSLSLISKVLYFSGGITRTIPFPPPLGSVEFRAASCTGALYHIEMYVVCSGLPGLEAGVYHYNPKDESLSALRTGDYGMVLGEAVAGRSSAPVSPATIVYTDIFSKNSIKYQAREYRHAFWDCGTILSNSLGMGCAHHIPHKVVLGFDDAMINGLLGIDGRGEAAVALLSLGTASVPTSPPPPLGKTPESQPTEFVMSSEAILEMHRASSLAAHEVADWRRQVPLECPPPTNPIPLGRQAASEASIEQAILRRGSTRRFSHEPISLEQVSTILKRATGGFPSDIGSGTVCDTYIISNAVNGLDSGSYHYHRGLDCLEALRIGDLRDISGHLGLDQNLPYDASATVFFLVDLQKVLQVLGNRGYRVAQIDASISAGRMYLACYALGIGATGLTFYDDEVTSFFEPHARGKSVMFMIALGNKAGKGKPEPHF